MTLTVDPAKVVAKAPLARRPAKRFARLSFVLEMLLVLLTTTGATASAEMDTVATLMTGKDVQLPLQLVAPVINSVQRIRCAGFHKEGRSPVCQLVMLFSVPLELFALLATTLASVLVLQDCMLVIPMVAAAKVSTAWKMMTAPLTSIVTGSPTLA